MSSHDEYSSDDESIIEGSNTQLGFVDVPIDEEVTIEDTILGGEPVWLHPQSFPDEKLITCKNCGNKMALYLQAFSPFGDEFHDRVIYIFGCLNTKTCSYKDGSIRCIRGISKDPIKMEELEKEQQREIQNELDQKLQLENKKKLRDELTKDLFGSGKADNPFSKNTDNPFSNPFASPFKSEPKQPEVKAETKTYASVTAETIPPVTKKEIVKYELPSYPGYFVFVEKEKFKKQGLDPELEKYKDLIDNNSINEEDVGPSSKVNLNPQQSKIANMLDDKFFETFSNTVQYNPGQVLRFDLGGKPLLYNGKDKVAKAFTTSPFNIPAPAINPSSSRQFELQLMPKTIIDLERDEINIMDGMSWGTIIVCTDVEDYVPPEYFDENHVAYVEEYCGVQWEESV
ncbi:20S rRNA accumulation protein 4 [[Candida] jaroonii]|uniref:20S rRNA accumulation protein 4 n=1 Tax=[Candida] jaroonii TaxID=467808 RepID=A0ACA9Y2S0_9ASCO|nr:20S rRNA accumulation protein 4 [[Candida] jaroonii]